MKAKSVKENSVYYDLIYGQLFVSSKWKDEGFGIKSINLTASAGNTKIKIQYADFMRASRLFFIGKF